MERSRPKCALVPTRAPPRLRLEPDRVFDAVDLGIHCHSVSQVCEQIPSLIAPFMHSSSLCFHSYHLSDIPELNYAIKVAENVQDPGSLISQSSIMRSRWRRAFTTRTSCSTSAPSASRGAYAAAEAAAAAAAAANSNDSTISLISQSSSMRSKWRSTFRTLAH